MVIKQQAEIYSPMSGEFKNKLNDDLILGKRIVHILPLFTDGGPTPKQVQSILVIFEYEEEINQKSGQ